MPVMVMLDQDLRGVGLGMIVDTQARHNHLGCSIRSGGFVSSRRLRDIQDLWRYRSISMLASQRQGKDSNMIPTPEYLMVLSCYQVNRRSLVSSSEVHLPRTTPLPSLPTHKPAFAVPVCREGTSVTVIAPDVASSLGPVLEVVAALAGLESCFSLDAWGSSIGLLRSNDGSSKPTLK